MAGWAPQGVARATAARAATGGTARRRRARTPLPCSRTCRRIAKRQQRALGRRRSVPPSYQTSLPRWCRRGCRPPARARRRPMQTRARGHACCRSRAPRRPGHRRPRSGQPTSRSGTTPRRRCRRLADSTARARRRTRRRAHDPSSYHLRRFHERQWRASCRRRSTRSPSCQTCPSPPRRRCRRAARRPADPNWPRSTRTPAHDPHTSGHRRCCCTAPRRQARCHCRSRRPIRRERESPARPKARCPDPSARPNRPRHRPSQRRARLPALAR